MKRSTPESAPRPAMADALGDLALQVEAEALLGAAGREVHVAAHAPQEFLAALGTAASSSAVNRPASTSSCGSRTR